MLGFSPQTHNAAFAIWPNRHLYQVTSTHYDAAHHIVDVYAKLFLERSSDRRAISTYGGERTFDTSSIDGLLNFATASYPTADVVQVRVITHDEPGRVHWEGFGHDRPTGDAVRTYAVPPRAAIHHRRTVPAHPIGPDLEEAGFPLPPPGVHMDLTLTPLAGLRATVAQKRSAVLREAASKLGTPYIWGHNEDRGQYGFDCSNFTEYVYHHALGYSFTTWSRLQCEHVGVSVPTADMQPGDLLCFDYGGHVGIYAGAGRMIQEGGGLRKVGYLPVRPGSYWYNHLTGVKRMF